MATPNVGILTNAGKNLIDQVNAGQTKITFSKIVFSSMDNNQLTDDQIKALTAITPQKIVVNNPEVTLDSNTGETRIRATGNNEALTDGVYVKTYAVYAKDDSGNEILYGITVSPNPNYLPEYDGVTPQAVTYSYKVNISNTSNITFTNSNDIYVSDTDLAEALQPYAKTVDVNQQLDKKVNIADMRKPASDVAGIEEVNAKQDKIAYTPADDSKVVHDNHDGTISLNGASILPADEYVIARIDGTYTDMNDIPMGWLYINGWAAGGIANWGLTQDFYYVHCYKAQFGAAYTTIQIAYGVQLNNTYVRTMSATPNATWTTWKLLADDSKVPHLSGANNFDTVPTVNNNPLLLASSLPSDLARTGQANTFTAAQTFSIAPVINDASKDKGDNQAATMADLKSVENSAWHDLKTTDVNGSFDVEILYQKLVSEKKLRFIFIADYKIDKNLSNYNFAIDLSKIITTFQTTWGASTQYLSAVFGNSAMDYKFNANTGSSLITCSEPINWTKDSGSLGIATSFLTTRTNGVLNDTLYVEGFKA